MTTPYRRPYRQFQPVYHARRAFDRGGREFGRGGSTGEFWWSGINHETGQGQYVLANGVVGALSHVHTRSCLLSIYGRLEWTRSPPKEGEPDRNGGVWRNIAGRREGVTTLDIVRRRLGDPQLHVNTPTAGGYRGPHYGPDPALAQAMTDLTGIPWAEVWAIQVREVHGGDFP